VKVTKSRAITFIPCLGLYGFFYGELLHILSKCVRVCNLVYPTLKAHASYCSVLCGLSNCTISSVYRKDVFECKICVLILSKTLLKHFLF
jgi:hypothetical protein